MSLLPSTDDDDAADFDAEPIPVRRYARLPRAAWAEATARLCRYPHASRRPSAPPSPPHPSQVRSGRMLRRLWPLAGRQREAQHGHGHLARRAQGGHARSGITTGREATAPPLPPDRCRKEYSLGVGGPPARKHPSHPEGQCMAPEPARATPSHKRPSLPPFPFPPPPPACNPPGDPLSSGDPALAVPRHAPR